MEMPLTFEYDDHGDILYINTVVPYPEQESDHLEYIDLPPDCAGGPS